MIESKILILLFYYDRPNLVKIALNSVQRQNYTNWEIAFIDDGSQIPGEPIAKNILSTHLDKIKFYNTNDTIQSKIERNGEEGSVFGMYAQQAVMESDADYVVMLCDDDALYPEYFNNLNKYFSLHETEQYVYSHIHAYDPLLTKIEDNPPYTHHHLNKTEELNPYFNIDMSQIAWRRQAQLKNNIKFAYPMTSNLDSLLYANMHSVFGSCKFSGFFSEYKAIGQGAYGDQLSHRMGKRLAGMNTPEDIYKITVQ
jgi:glycosyltransferase involved in cell wall biosynthesis